MSLVFSCNGHLLDLKCSISSFRFSTVYKEPVHQTAPYPYQTLLRRWIAFCSPGSGHQLTTFGEYGKWCQFRGVIWCEEIPRNFTSVDTLMRLHRRLHVISIDQSIVGAFTIWCYTLNCRMCNVWHKTSMWCHVMPRWVDGIFKLFNEF